MSIDKAGEVYWTDLWENSSLSEPIDAILKNFNYHPEKRTQQYFHNIFSKPGTKGKTILEIGCGNGAWLPYFAKEYGLIVSGLDYSEHGCEQARQILARDGATGSIYCANFFNPPAELLNSFDFVISMGVIEHFSDTSEVLKTFSNFLKEGGILITTVPNFSGARGYVQKKINRPIYDIHIPMDKNHLDEHIEKAGLKLIDSRYSGSIAFRIDMNDKHPHYKLQRLFVLTLCRITKFFWLLETLIGPLPERKFFSSEILSTAQKNH